MLALGLLSTLLWRAALSQPDGSLHLTALNLPESPALLVQSADGKALLVNGGSSASQLSSALGQRLPFFRRRLDALLVTEQGARALEALPVTVERFPAGLVLWNEEAAGKKAGERLGEVLNLQGTQPQWLQSGQKIRLGDDASLQVLLHTTSGTALLLEWKDFQALIPGGISLETLQRNFSAQLAGVDVLLLDETDLAETAPALWEGLDAMLILYAGEGSEGIPVEDGRWVRLAYYAWVNVETDGRRMWMQAGQASRR